MFSQIEGVQNSTNKAIFCCFQCSIGNFTWRPTLCYPALLYNYYD